MQEYCSAHVASGLHPRIGSRWYNECHLAALASFRNEVMTKYIALGAIAALVLGTTAGSAADLPMKQRPRRLRRSTIGPVSTLVFRVAESLGQSTHIDRATGLGDTIGYNVKGGLVGGHAWL